jgi:hypothetical protein
VADFYKHCDETSVSGAKELVKRKHHQLINCQMIKSHPLLIYDYVC